jgi:hypothetical protein
MAAYPALLWLSIAASLLGSIQFGEHVPAVAAPTARAPCCERPAAPAACRAPAALLRNLCRHHCLLLLMLPSGYHLGVLNTCESHVEDDLGALHQLGAALVASLLIGATLGSLVAGRLADRLGPR